MITRPESIATESDDGPCPTAQRWLVRLVWVSLVWVFGVVIAGATVRATGSGMGCPDWPRCFGHLIPPTSAEQITWAPARAFAAGHMIIHPVRDPDLGIELDRLLVARVDLVTGDQFESANWDRFTRHDYAVFNVAHTWTEFINRLLGAGSGLPVLAMTLLAWFVSIKRRDPWPALLSTLAVATLLGVAWLGRVVVDGKLIPHHITWHMVGAGALIAILVALLTHRVERSAIPGWQRVVLGVCVVIAVVQILVGTQIREFIDAELAGGNTRVGIAEAMPTSFYWHRSLSWAMTALVVVWGLASWRHGGLRGYVVAVFGLLLAQISVGVILAEFYLPAVLQPVHLVGALALAAVLWMAWRRSCCAVRN